MPTFPTPRRFVLSVSIPVEQIVRVWALIKEKMMKKGKGKSKGKGNC